MSEINLKRIGLNSEIEKALVFVVNIPTSDKCWLAKLPMNNFFVVLTSQYFDASDIMQSIFSMKISHEIPLMCSTDSFEDEKKIERILCALLETISLEQILSRSLFRGVALKNSIPTVIWMGFRAYRLLLWHFIWTFVKNQNHLLNKRKTSSYPRCYRGHKV